MIDDVAEFCSRTWQERHDAIEATLVPNLIRQRFA